MFFANVAVLLALGVSTAAASDSKSLLRGRGEADKLYPRNAGPKAMKLFETMHALADISKATKEAEPPKLKAINTNVENLTRRKLCEARLVDSLAFYYPRVAISGDVGVVTSAEKGQRTGGLVKFFNISEGGLELAAQFETTARPLEVAISGDTAVVGLPSTPSSTSTNRWVGSVNVYERNAGIWEQSAHIQSDDDIKGLRFGYSVDIDGDLIVIGADNDDRGPGPAYAYHWNGTLWTPEAKPDLVGDNTLSVSLRENMLAVATYDNDGTVSIFEREEETWRRLSGALSSDDCPGWFGKSVALAEGGGLLVACGRRSSLTHTGVLYHYARSEPTGEYLLSQKIETADNGGIHQLGDIIAVDGDVMVVGGDGDNDLFVLTRSGGSWSVEMSIAAPDGSEDFGWSVALSGYKILVAATNNVYSYSLEPCPPPTLIELNPGGTLSKRGNRRACAWDHCPSAGFNWSQGLSSGCTCVGGLNSCFMEGEEVTEVEFLQARLIPAGPDKYKLVAVEEEGELTLGEGRDVASGDTCFDDPLRAGFSIDLAGTGFTFAEGSSVWVSGWAASMRVWVDNSIVHIMWDWAGGNFDIPAGGTLLEVNCGGWSGACASEIFVASSASVGL